MGLVIAIAVVAGVADIATAQEDIADVIVGRWIEEVHLTAGTPDERQTLRIHKTYTDDGYGVAVVEYREIRSESNAFTWEFIPATDGDSFGVIRESWETPRHRPPLFSQSHVKFWADRSGEPMIVSQYVLNAYFGPFDPGFSFGGFGRKEQIGHFFP